MSEIKQVWEIIKDHQCAELQMVQGPALAVWNHQQAIIDDLKAQLNNMEACYIEKKEVEAVSQVLCELKESLKDFQEMDLYDKGHRVTTEYVIADLEKALRGEL